MPQTLTYSIFSSPDILLRPRRKRDRKKASRRERHVLILNQTGVMSYLPNLIYKSNLHSTQAVFRHLDG